MARILQDGLVPVIWPLALRVGPVEEKTKTAMQIFCQETKRILARGEGIC